MKALGGCSEGGYPALSGWVRIPLPRSCSSSSIRNFTDTYTIWIHNWGERNEKMGFPYGNHPALGFSEFRMISLELSILYRRWIISVHQEADFWSTWFDMINAWSLHEEGVLRFYCSKENRGCTDFPFDHFSKFRFLVCNNAL